MNPRKFLVVVTVTPYANGSVQYAYLEFFNNQQLPDKRLRGVKPGDLIAWTLTVKVNGRKVKAPFRLNFDDNRLLGTRIVNVPVGGVSAFYTIQSLSGLFKYDVTLPTFPAIPTDDPEVQMDTMAARMPSEGIAGDVYFINGSLSEKGEFSFSYTVNGAQLGTLPSPLPVSEGANITWTLLNAGPVAANFEAVFEDRQTFSLPVVGDPFSNTIGGDLALGKLSKTAVKTARHLEDGENPVFEYNILALGFTSQPLSIMLSNFDAASKAC